MHLRHPADVTRTRTRLFPHALVVASETAVVVGAVDWALFGSGRHLVERMRRLWEGEGRAFPHAAIRSVGLG